MPFASKAQATDENGNIKKGFKEIIDKNGKTKYLSENRPSSKVTVAKKVKEVKIKETEPIEVPKKEKKVKKNKKGEVLIDPFYLPAVES